MEDVELVYESWRSAAAIPVLSSQVFGGCMGFVEEAELRGSELGEHSFEDAPEWLRLLLRSIFQDFPSDFVCPHAVPNLAAIVKAACNLLIDRAGDLMRVGHGPAEVQSLGQLHVQGLIESGSKLQPSCA